MTKSFNFLWGKVKDAWKGLKDLKKHQWALILAIIFFVGAFVCLFKEWFAVLVFCPLFFFVALRVFIVNKDNQNNNSIWKDIWKETVKYHTPIILWLVVCVWVVTYIYR